MTPVYLEHCQKAETWNNIAHEGNNYLSPNPFTETYGLDMIELVIGKDPRRVIALDVACGAGALTFHLSAKVHKYGGSIIAIDFAKKMAEKLRRGVAMRGVPNVTVQEMDGQELTFIDNTFDYAFSAFGVVFFNDRFKGLQEMHRVIKPSGKASILSWPPTNFLQHIVQTSFERAAPSIPFPHRLNMSMFSFGETSDLKATLERAGFINVVVHEIKHKFNFHTRSFTSFFLGNPITTAICNELPTADLKARYYKEYVDLMEELYPQDDMTFESIIHIAIGEKSSPTPHPVQ
eukprot:gene9169-10760_t